MTRTRSRLMLMLVVALLALQPMLHLHPSDGDANGAKSAGIECALCDAHAVAAPAAGVVARFVLLAETLHPAPFARPGSEFAPALSSRGPPAA